MLENIINELFESADMRSYLCEHISELNKYQIIDMIVEAPSVSLQRKAELFETLAENEDLEAEIAVEPPNIELIREFSYSSYADRIRNALNELKSTAASDIFLLNTYEWSEKDFVLSETVPFASYEKTAEYLNEQYCDDKRIYHILEKRHTDKNMNMKNTYWYIIANGQVIYFCNTENRLDVYPECRLNLPVPFKSGDIITVQDLPFAEKQQALILDVGDNVDCCCVQILYVSDDGQIKINALKHGHILNTNSSPTTSPLYSAEILKESSGDINQVLLSVSRYIS